MYDVSRPTGTVGGAEGRPKKACVPRCRYTLPSRKGGNG